MSDGGRNTCNGDDGRMQGGVQNNVYSGGNDDNERKFVVLVRRQSENWC